MGDWFFKNMSPIGGIAKLTQYLGNAKLYKGVSGADIVRYAQNDPDGFKQAASSGFSEGTSYMTNELITKPINAFDDGVEDVEKTLSTPLLIAGGIFLLVFLAPRG